MAFEAYMSNAPIELPCLDCEGNQLDPPEAQASSQEGEHRTYKVEGKHRTYKVEEKHRTYMVEIGKITNELGSRKNVHISNCHSSHLHNACSPALQLSKDNKCRGKPFLTIWVPICQSPVAVTDEWFQ